MKTLTHTGNADDGANGDRDVERKPQIHFLVPDSRIRWNLASGRRDA
jgi:hypothetical protein